MFEIGGKTFTGVDIGTASIKAVEIKIRDKKPVLSNYASIKISSPKSDGIQVMSEEFLAECLKKMLNEGKLSRGDFFMSVQSFGALITLIKLPMVAKEDLEQAFNLKLINIFQPLWKMFP